MGLLCFVLAVLASPFKSKLRLQAENAVLRHQLIVLRSAAVDTAHVGQIYLGCKRQAEICSRRL
jgi:hypothetical protein